MKNSQCNRDSFGPLEELSQDMERVFDSLLGRTVGNVLRPSGAEKYVPSMDVYENDTAYVVALDLPGVKPEDVKIEMHEGKLSVSGSRELAKGETSDKFHRVERSGGKFHRVLSLANDVDLEKIDAAYDHGVLTITLPKVEKQQPTKIEIRTS